VLDAIRIAMIDKAGGEFVDDGAPGEALKRELAGLTLRFDQRAPPTPEVV
jgi:hypothetical protein